MIGQNAKKIGFFTVLMIFSLGFFVTTIQAGEPVKAKNGGKLYGFARMDIAYDTSRLHPGNYVVYAKPKMANGQIDNELNITASSSRIGYKYSGMLEDNLRVDGGIEVDFYGGGKENQAYLRMRLAFIEFVFPESDMKILAGQHWDLLMVQHPGSFDDGISWYAGNLGYRRPQLRICKKINLAEKTDMIMKAALARNIGDAIAASPGDTGEDAATPVAQLLFKYSSPLFMMALSGHYGQEEYDTNATNEFDLYQTYSARVDLAVPFGTMAGLKVCAWTGTNMDSYMGGIGQGINTADKVSIDSKGGFVALNVGKIVVGGSVDMPKYDQLASGARQQNTKVFVSSTFSLAKAVTLGLELAKWQTLYKDADDGDALRAHAMVKCSF